MNKKEFCILFLVHLINFTAEETKIHSISLNTEGSLIDDELLSNEGIYGVTEINRVIRIREPGTFILQGDYLGQVKVKLNDEHEEVTLILNGINITYPDGPGILITKTNEIDETEYSRESPIAYEKR